MNRHRIDTATGHIRNADDAPLCGNRGNDRTPAGNCTTCVLTIRLDPAVPIELDGSVLHGPRGCAADVLAGRHLDGPPPPHPAATWQTVTSPGTTRTHIALQALTVAHNGRAIAFPAATTLCMRPLGDPVTGHVDPADRCITCARSRRDADLPHHTGLDPAPMTTAVFLDDGDPIPQQPQPDERVVVADIDTQDGCAALTGFRMPSLSGSTAHNVDGAPKTSGTGPAYTVPVRDRSTPCAVRQSTMLGGCTDCTDTIRSVARSAEAEWHLAIGTGFVAVAIDGNPVPTEVLLSGSTSEPAADPTFAGRWRPEGDGRSRMDLVAVPNGRVTHLAWSVRSTTDPTGQTWQATPDRPVRTLCGKAPDPDSSPPPNQRWCTACGKRLVAVLANPDRTNATHPGVAIGDTHLTPDAAGLPLPVIYGLLDRDRHP
ncbi:hypothetical protein [Euzebya pacifica]|nr:hypothetical protein [Euzebya pacifica]